MTTIGTHDFCSPPADTVFDTGVERRRGLDDLEETALFLSFAMILLNSDGR